MFNNRECRNKQVCVYVLIVLAIIQVKFSVILFLIETPNKTGVQNIINFYNIKYNTTKYKCDG